MADFCRQCSLAIFGEDYGDLSGITTEAKWEAGLATVVLCEGCGPIQVDPDGSCVSPNCLRSGAHEQKGRVWVTGTDDQFEPERGLAIGLLIILVLLVVAALVWYHVS